MRYKVEYIKYSDSGEKIELFRVFVHAVDHSDAVDSAQKEYATTHPDSPVPPSGYTWFSYESSEEEYEG